MTNDLIPFYFFGIVDRAILYLIDLPALNTGDVVMMVIAMNSRTQSVMLFAVKLLDPRQDAAFNEALKIAVHTGKPALVKLLFKPPPHLFRSQVGLPINKKLDDRLPARRELEPAFF